MDHNDDKPASTQVANATVGGNLRFEDSDGASTGRAETCSNFESSEDEGPDTLMYVTTEELEWARTIKRALMDAAVAINDVDYDARIYQQVDLDALEYREQLVAAASFLTDLDLLEHSFTTECGDLTSALKSISAMQHFREEYQIQESVDEAVEMVSRFVRSVMPGLILSVGWDDNTDHYHLILDMAKGRGDQVDAVENSATAEENVRSQMGAFFYIFQAVQPDVAAMRKGVIFVAECEGMAWQNLYFPGLRQFYTDLRSVYPLKHKEVTWLHPPQAATVLAQFLRPVMAAEMRKKLQIGAAFEDNEERLDRLVFVPSEEAANSRLVSNVRRFLSRRYENARNFDLGT